MTKLWQWVFSDNSLTVRWRVPPYTVSPSSYNPLHLSLLELSSIMSSKIRHLHNPAIFIRWQSSNNIFFLQLFLCFFWSNLAKYACFSLRGSESLRHSLFRSLLSVLDISSHTFPPAIMYHWSCNYLQRSLLPLHEGTLWSAELQPVNGNSYTDVTYFLDYTLFPTPGSEYLYVLQEPTAHPMQSYNSWVLVHVF